MAVLIVGFGTGSPAIVAVAEAAEDTPKSVGVAAEAFAGNMRSGVRTVKPRWRIVTAQIDTTALGVLLAYHGKITPCSGDLFFGVTTNCLMLYTGKKLGTIAAPVAGYNWLYEVTFVLQVA